MVYMPELIIPCRGALCNEVLVVCVRTLETTMCLGRLTCSVSVYWVDLMDFDSNTAV